MYGRRNVTNIPIPSAPPAVEMTKRKFVINAVTYTHLPIEDQQGIRFLKKTKLARIIRCISCGLWGRGVFKVEAASVTACDYLPATRLV